MCAIAAARLIDALRIIVVVAAAAIIVAVVVGVVVAGWSLCREAQPIKAKTHPGGFLREPPPRGICSID